MKKTQAAKIFFIALMVFIFFDISCFFLNLLKTKGEYMPKYIVGCDTETTGLLEPIGTDLKLQPHIIEIYAVKINPATDKMTAKSSPRPNFSFRKITAPKMVIIGKV